MATDAVPGHDARTHASQPDGGGETVIPEPKVSSAPIVADPATGPAEVLATVLTSEMPNVYHEAFRRPNLTAHPSTFIPGFPESARPLNLTLGAESWEAAWSADEATWNSVEPDQWYYVPGTVIAGLKSKYGGITRDLVADFHGSGVAFNALLAGGSSATSLIVDVDASNRDMAMLAARSPFIDVVTRSTISPLPPGWAGEWHRYLYVHDHGGIVLNGAPNGLYVNPNCSSLSSADCGSSGPPWVVTVGEVARESIVVGSGPLDIATPHGRCPRADSLKGMSDCMGTSFSTPYFAGLLAEALVGVRSEWGWEICPGVRACAPDGQDLPSSGPLADGRLDREELLHAFYRTAYLGHRFQTAADAPMRDDGWGITDVDALDDVASVLWGSAAPPDRPEVEARWNFYQGLRHTYWDPWVPVWERSEAVCPVFSHPTC